MSAPNSNINNIDINIDVVTALQDEIDAFSLSLFEALRGLRDVSTGVTAATATATQLSQYNHDNNHTMISISTGKQLMSGISSSPGKSNNSGEEDSNIVQVLSSCALEKSANINQWLDQIQGLNRNKADQLRKLEELLKENQQIDTEFQEMILKAKEQKERVRDELQSETCSVLGVSVENNVNNANMEK